MSRQNGSGLSSGRSKSSLVVARWGPSSTMSARVPSTSGPGRMGNTESYAQYVPFFSPCVLSDSDFFVVLQQDFPFYIRIPESLPPTIALEKGGKFHLKNSPHPATYHYFSWYQVRVDCHRLHQGQKVRSFGLTSQSHVHPNS